MITCLAVAHLGIRVSDAARAIAFYEKLGFRFLWQGGPEPVAILENVAGVEVNLIVNASPAETPVNVLMDIPEKHPGYTHVALSVASMEETVAELGRLGVPITGGPMELGGRLSLFVRDPDRNVVELREARPSGA